MLFFLASGIIVSIPMALFFEPSTTFLGRYFSDVTSLILAVVILAPIIEEFAKAYPLFYRHGESQRSLFSMGFLVGLGFGIVEFLAYVIIVGVPWYVRVPGLFFHAALTSIVAYGIAEKHATGFYLLAVFFHASVNLLAVLEVSFLLYGVFLGTVFVLSFLLYSRASEQVTQY